MPEQIKKFIEFYKRIIATIDPQALAHWVINAKSTKLPEDLLRAATAVARGGPAERSLATTWLNADKPQLVELRRGTGILSRIEDDTHAADILCGILSAMAEAKIRMVLLVDEFQRIGVLNNRSRDNFLSNFRSIFSRTPSFLSVVLAVGCRVERNALELLPQELKTLLGVRPAISLPEMSEAEAFEFVIERFRFFRPTCFKGKETEPFEPEALKEVIKYVSAKGVPLIPRKLTQCLAWIYDESIMDGMEHITSEFASESLKGLRWEEADGQSTKN